MKAMILRIIHVGYPPGPFSGKGGDQSESALRAD